MRELTGYVLAGLLAASLTQLALAVKLNTVVDGDRSEERPPEDGAPMRPYHGDERDGWDDSCGSTSTDSTEWLERLLDYDEFLQGYNSENKKKWADRKRRRDERAARRREREREQLEGRTARAEPSQPSRPGQAQSAGRNVPSGHHGSREVAMGPTSKETKRKDDERSKEVKSKEVKSKEVKSKERDDRSKEVHRIAGRRLDRTIESSKEDHRNQIAPERTREWAESGRLLKQGQEETSKELAKGKERKKRNEDSILPYTGRDIRRDSYWAQQQQQQQQPQQILAAGRPMKAVSRRSSAASLGSGGNRPAGYGKPTPHPKALDGHGGQKVFGGQPKADGNGPIDPYLGPQVYDPPGKAKGGAPLKKTFQEPYGPTEQRKKGANRQEGADTVAQPLLKRQPSVSPPRRGTGQPDFRTPAGQPGKAREGLQPPPRDRHRPESIEQIRREAQKDWDRFGDDNRQREFDYDGPRDNARAPQAGRDGERRDREVDRPKVLKEAVPKHYEKPADRDGRRDYETNRQRDRDGHRSRLTTDDRQDQPPVGRQRQGHDEHNRGDHTWDGYDRVQINPRDRERTAPTDQFPARRTIKPLGLINWNDYGNPPTAGLEGQPRDREGRPAKDREAQQPWDLKDQLEDRQNWDWTNDYGMQSTAGREGQPRDRENRPAKDREAPQPKDREGRPARDRETEQPRDKEDRPTKDGGDRLAKHREAPRPRDREGRPARGSETEQPRNPRDRKGSDRDDPKSKKRPIA